MNLECGYVQKKSTEYSAIIKSKPNTWCRSISGNDSFSYLSPTALDFSFYIFIFLDIRTSKEKLVLFHVTKIFEMLQSVLKLKKPVKIRFRNNKMKKDLKEIENKENFVKKEKLKKKQP